MTFKEWREAGGRFKLCGGPADGTELSPGPGLRGWPSDLYLNGDYRYTMRIGDPDHYDYVSGGDTPVTAT